MPARAAGKNQTKSISARKNKSNTQIDNVHNHKLCGKQWKNKKRQKSFLGKIHKHQQHLNLFFHGVHVLRYR